MTQLSGSISLPVRGPLGYGALGKQPAIQPHYGTNKMQCCAVKGLEQTDSHWIPCQLTRALSAVYSWVLSKLTVIGSHAD